jgi:hypothetical protein
VFSAEKFLDFSKTKHPATIKLPLKSGGIVKEVQAKSGHPRGRIQILKDYPCALAPSSRGKRGSVNAASSSSAMLGRDTPSII